MSTFIRNYNIAGHRVAHFQVNAEEMRARCKLLRTLDENEETPEGLCDLAQSSIYTLDDVSDDREADTLRHELAHYFFEATGLASWLKGVIKSKDYAAFEETIIRLAIPWLVHFEKNNAKDST